MKSVNMPSKLEELAEKDSNMYLFFVSINFTTFRGLTYALNHILNITPADFISRGVTSSYTT